MAEKLSITIALDGAAEIEQQLAGIGQAGTKAFEQIGAAAEKVGGFDKLDPKDVQAKLQQFGVKGKEAIDKITAAVAAAGRLERIAGGVRQIEAGFTTIGAAASTMSQRVTGAFTAVATAAASTGGAIGRVGRSLGLIGGGAIVGSLGAAALAIEKTADEARVLEGNLQALFRNAAAGTAFFNQIQQSAQGAGASLASTSKAMLDIASAIRSAAAARGFRFAPGEEMKRASADAQQLFDILQQGMKLSGVRADEATKAIGKLFTEIATRGQLSGDTLRKFAAEFPQLANELVKFLGIPGQSMEQLADQVDKGFRKIDLPKFINAIKRAGPEIQKLSDAFEPTLAQRIDTIAGAWDRLLNSFGKSPAGDVVRQTMDDIAKGLDEIAKKQEQAGKFTVTKPPETLTGEFLNEVLKTIETTKKEWEALVSLINTTKFNLGLKGQLPDKIAIPFEAAPEPPFVESYLAAIEKVKTAFKSIFTPTVAAEGAPEPAFVQSYLAAIEKVKAVFAAIFTPTVAAVGAPEPAFVQTYLAAIETVKTAFAAIFTPTVAAEGAPEPAFVQAYLTAIETIKTALGSITWDSITSGAVAAWNAIIGAIQSTQSAIAQFASSLASITWDAISSAGVAAWNAITSAVERAISAIQRFLGLRGGGGASAPAGAAGGQFASGGLLRGRGTGTSDSNLVWVSRGEYIVPARVVRQPGVLALLEALRQSGGSRQKNGLPAFQAGGQVGDGGVAAIGRIIQQIAQVAQAALQGAIATITQLNQLSIGIQTANTQAVNLIAQQAQALINSLNESSASLVNAVLQIGELVKQSSNQTVNALNAIIQSGIGGRASGGLLGGRGTGTSDSNLVRVSRGEYIVPARAVRQPGVLAFLEALRHSGGNLRDVLDDMGRFALGGLVPRTVPAFATGGLAGGGMSNVTIQFPGLPEISGLRASAKVVDELRKSAALAQVRSGGRKPSRYS
jgi:Tape measure protein